MDPLQFLVPLGWLSAVGPALPYAIFVMTVANLATRHLAHRRHVEQGQDADSVEAYTPHVFTNVGLVLLTFLYILTAPVRGTILIVLVLAMFIADLFELEARNVEARNDMEIEAPKSSIAASLVVLIWSSYYALFFLVEGIWNQFVVA
ncbi:MULTISPECIES: hypothetical protein [Halorubrum]|jgi:hypothetical protein|uniref:DUF7313 domain-containing protein n=1 Tax=Halorubrum tropicale TaxID=1765655 RepID=A0A0M9AQT0_9EURY|nr:MULTISPECIES: hypothetical protein [Halorubrum]KOX96448.1 hypothetical protein AMR74_08380 [Halorubrum tropicale]RLM52406.1 hypothetical protein DVK06_02610 [Halorubrum sp. Atlit-28R]RLM71198.1 hypothetical protein DVK08_03400 [Halorubrum sp. Atlit-9R]RLM72066.1 hypothetical protein DVK08_08145 [Halorubrum sp. Atlit-9R]RLM82650.1 hypothetical protein DVK05_02360 [Halorubrum sp. Atlit-8R]